VDLSNRSEEVMLVKIKLEERAYEASYRKNHWPDLGVDWGARGSIVVKTLLQTGRSRVRFPMRIFKFA
jgi:hypothetical protein